MIGVVCVGPASSRRVLGLSIAARATLALQAAGAVEVLFVGADADRCLASIAGDDRLRIPVRVTDAWPAGRALIVGDGVVVDARALRAMAADDRDEPRAILYAEVVLARTGRAASSLRALQSGNEIPITGVAVLARDPAGARMATRALLDSLRKSQDGWISTRLNRHISLVISRGLVWLPIRPNTLSVGILALGLYSGWLASRGSYATLAIGGVLFQLASILDGCDGELSRLTFRGSKLGEWLDTIGDDLTNYSFFAGAAIGVAAMGWGAFALSVGAAGVLIGVVTSAIEYRYLISIGSGDLLKYPLGFGNDPEPSRPTTLASRALGAIRPAFKRDFFVFITMLAALAGPAAMLVMLGLFLAGALATFGAVIASEIRRARGRS